MLNQIVLVGRLVSDPQINETEENNKISRITLAVPRAYKNANGEYDTDFIPIILYKGIASTTTEYCRKGDLLGIKGRLQVNDDNIVVVAEKVTFLSSRKEESEEV